MSLCGGNKMSDKKVDILRMLRPHEKKILESELHREELLQQRLADAIVGSMTEHAEKMTFNAFKVITEELKIYGISKKEIDDCNKEGKEYKKIRTLIWMVMKRHEKLLAKIPMWKLEQIMGDLDKCQKI